MCGGGLFHLILGARNVREMCAAAACRSSHKYWPYSRFLDFFFIGYFNIHTHIELCSFSYICSSRNKTCWFQSILYLRKQLLHLFFIPQHTSLFYTYTPCVYVCGVVHSFLHQIMYINIWTRFILNQRAQAF